MPTDIKKIKKELSEEKERLEKELNQLTQGSSKDSHAKYEELGSQEDDNAAEVTLLDKNISLKNDLEKNLKSVQRALQRIDDGQYGICEECGKLIEDKRLEAFSAATLCIECKKRKENLG